MIYLSEIKRFWPKVDVRSPDECWEWQGNISAGYGRLKINGENVGAHRISWEIHNGSIPHGMYILHKCDNRRCVNPNHLYLGTQSDNISDREYRGPTTHGRPSRLGPEGIKKLRRLWKSGEYKQWQLAKMFDISKGYTSALINHIYGDYTVKEKPYG